MEKKQIVKAALANRKKKGFKMGANPFPGGVEKPSGEKSEKGATYRSNKKAGDSKTGAVFWKKVKKG